MQPADSPWSDKSSRHGTMTRDFARRFPAERRIFLASVEGLLAPDERERCVSSLIGRQLFLRFLPADLRSQVGLHQLQPSSPTIQVPDE